MDFDGDGSVTVEEAVAFWKAFLPEVGANPEAETLVRPGLDDTFPGTDPVRTLFGNVDENPDGRLTLSEFLRFFEGLKNLGTSDEDIAAMCEAIVANGTWIVWKTNRGVVCAKNIRAWEFAPSHCVGSVRGDGPARSQAHVDVRDLEFEPSDHMHFFCPNQDCGWTGSSENLKEHTDGCAWRGRADEVQEHVTSSGHFSRRPVAQRPEQPESALIVSATLAGDELGHRDRVERANWIWNRMLPSFVLEARETSRPLSPNPQVTSRVWHADSEFAPSP
jgi:hypothetical protein